LDIVQKIWALGKLFIPLGAPSWLYKYTVCLTVNNTSVMGGFLLMLLVTFSVETLS